MDEGEEAPGEVGWEEFREVTLPSSVLLRPPLPMMVDTDSASSLREDIGVGVGVGVGAGAG